MKHMKKWLAIALALVLTLALAVPALAAEVTWEKMTKGNTVLAPEDAYTPESVQAALKAYEAYCNTVTGSKKEKEVYNNEFKPAILGLEFKSHSFTDAESGAWYNKALNYVAATGMMKGTGDNLFTPDGELTRGMAVTILWRMNGSEAPKAPAAFSDVPADAWFADAVAWAVENKITLGVSDTSFAPEVPVNREQMATFFSRMLIALSGQSGNLHLTEAQMRSYLASKYSDAAQISSFALQHVIICSETGLMQGSNGAFSPQNVITRAQGAQMLMNYYLFLLKATFRDL